MCVGVPMQIVSAEGFIGFAADGDEVHEIDLALTGPLRPGQWVLTFLGAAREVISAREAEDISRALDGLRAVMRGEGAGDAFADLEERGPQLPPHLQTAFNDRKDIA